MEPHTEKAFLSKLFVLFLGVTAVHNMEDKHHWRGVAQEELAESLSYNWNTKSARNVVLFVGDGMSPDTITASRIYHRGEDSYLSWEKFPHVGLLKTYDINKQVPDSASTATALFCGVKTNFEVAGVDMNVPLADCEASLNTEYHLDSIIAWAQAAGKDTGFVTTTRVTHATPAALYAHTADRRWECEDTMPDTAANCKDIARQLIEDEPGKNIKVIMGGGRQMLQSYSSATDIDPLDTWACYSKDGRDLMKDWAVDKAARNFTYKIVENNEELSQVDLKSTDYLLGIFANGHINMDWTREQGPKGQPSLEEMTTAALKVLQKSENGFLLVVEGGLIDYAHHRGHAAQALQETVRLSDAINATLNLVDIDDTLIVVTSDHTHSLTFNGYSNRGSNILGIAQQSRLDQIPYTTLGYSTGGSNNFAYEVVDGQAVRKDPSLENTTEFTYSQQAAIITDEAYHGGGDVIVYAMGPFSHLFHSTHEQNFVAHAIAYAARIGEHATAGSSGVNANVCLSTLLTVLFLLQR